MKGSGRATSTDTACHRLRPYTPPPQGERRDGGGTYRPLPLRFGVILLDDVCRNPAVVAALQAPWTSLSYGSPGSQHAGLRAVQRCVLRVTDELSRPGRLSATLTHCRLVLLRAPFGQAAGDRSMTPSSGYGAPPCRSVGSPRRGQLRVPSAVPRPLAGSAAVLARRTMPRLPGRPWLWRRRPPRRRGASSRQQTSPPRPARRRTG